MCSQFNIRKKTILLFHIRHRADAEANASVAYKFDQSAKRTNNSTWAELAIGDIVLVKSRSTIPADIVILGVSEKSSIKTGICYVETKSLDGETNLKVRNAMPVTMKEVHIITHLWYSFPRPISSLLFCLFLVTI